MSILDTRVNIIYIYMMRRRWQIQSELSGKFDELMRENSASMSYLYDQKH